MNSFLLRGKRRQAQILLLATLLFLTVFSTLAFAGGSWISVYVQKITMLSDTDYILVVEPVSEQEASQDPFFGGCGYFEVQGTFSRRSGQPWFWTLYPSVRKQNEQNRIKHLAALKKLQQLEETRTPLNFGWMGTGFNIIDEKNPCVVESRTLGLVEDGGIIAIMSYFK